MKIKKIIIILLILLIIVAIVLGAVILYRNNQENIEFDPPQEDIQIDIQKEVKRVDIRNNFYAVRTCVEKFYSYLTETDESDYGIVDEEVEQTIEAAQNQSKQAVYNMLDDNYIQDRGITEENVSEQFPQIASSDVIIDDMYVSAQTESMYAYFVSGKLRNRTTWENTDFTLMLKVDMQNRTFKIVPADYITEYVDQIQIGQELNLDIGTSIEKNDFNIFDYENISIETYITDMFNEFKNDMMYDYESAYELLNEEYKNKRFETYEEFQSYAEDNYRNSVIMSLSQYQRNEYDDYTQYICVDQNGEYYIFNETGVMDYTVILDTYTIDLPQFVEQYNNSQDSEKVLLNIQKVFEAINDHDYRYVYNKLDATFKANNFPTEESFEEYITNTFFDNNSIGYQEYQTRGDLHIYTIVVSDADNADSAEVTKQFIMQLGEGTDFVMSFNIE